MADYAVPLRSDRWTLAGAGPITIDSGGAKIVARLAAANPGPSAKKGIAFGGTDDDGRYIYGGADNLWLRLAAPRSNEPIEVRAIKEGATGTTVAPYLPNLAFSTNADTTLTGAAGALLAGLVAQNACTITAASDAAGAFTIGTAKNLAAGGALTINANGSYTFNPDGDFATLKGDATAPIGTVTITVTDGTNSLTTTATLDITVSGVNDGPTAVNDTASTLNNAKKSGNFKTDGTDDSHPQAEPMWVDRINGVAFAGGLPIKLASGATLTVNGETGAWVYDPKGRAAGNEVITYRLIDRFGATDEGTLTIAVSAP